MKSWTAIVLCIVLTVLGFGLGWWSKPTPVTQVQPGKVVHDTLTVHDTLHTPYVPQPATAPTPDDTTPEDTTTHPQPVIRSVRINPTVGAAKVDIIYELPSEMRPLGVVTKAVVEYPRYSDTVFVPIEIPTEVYRTDLTLLGLVTLGFSILSFLLGLSI